MNLMERALSAGGYQVLNVDYPSRAGSIEQLSDATIGKAVRECQRAGAPRIHFVTHSLGGVLVHSYLTQHTLTNLGHFMMLGPPNQGSEIVNKLQKSWLFRSIAGPAELELATDADFILAKLDSPIYSVGVIAGNRSLNWINSLMIPGRDDGKVYNERTKLAGMADHLIVPATHPFLPRNKTSIQQTISFLSTGRFESATESEHGKASARFLSPRIGELELAGGDLRDRTAHGPIRKSQYDIGRGQHCCRCAVCW